MGYVGSARRAFITRTCNNLLARAWATIMEKRRRVMTSAMVRRGPDLVGQLPSKGLGREREYSDQQSASTWSSRRRMFGAISALKMQLLVGNQ